MTTVRNLDTRWIKVWKMLAENTWAPIYAILKWHYLLMYCVTSYGNWKLAQMAIDNDSTTGHGSRGCCDQNMLPGLHMILFLYKWRTCKSELTYILEVSQIQTEARNIFHNSEMVPWTCVLKTDSTINLVTSAILVSRHARKRAH